MPSSCWRCLKAPKRSPDAPSCWPGSFWPAAIGRGLPVRRDVHTDTIRPAEGPTTSSHRSIPTADGSRGGTSRTCSKGSAPPSPHHPDAYRSSTPSTTIGSPAVAMRPRTPSSIHRITRRRIPSSSLHPPGCPWMRGTGAPPSWSIPNSSPWSPLRSSMSRPRRLLWAWGTPPVH